MLEKITYIVLKQILTKLILFARNYGAEKLKNNKAYIEFLHELGYHKPDDDFESIYIHAIVIFAASGEKEEEVIKLFLEEEVKKAFFKAYKINNIEGFEREINHQLHINPLVKNIKNWDKIPTNEITVFKEIFKKLNLDILSPTDVIILKEIMDNKDETKEGFANTQRQLEEIKAMFFSNNTGDTSEVLNKEFKAILDEYKELIDANKVDIPLQGLLNLKERNWNLFNSQTRYRILTNIGICYLRKDMQKESALFFIEALEFKSEDKEAITNAAIGYIFIDEISKAIVLAEKLGDINSAKILALKIRAKKIENDEIIHLLENEENSNNEEFLLASINHFVNIQNYELAKKYCEKLMEVVPKTILYKEFYVQIVTNLYGSQNHMVVRDLQGLTSSPILNNVITLCDVCWQHYSKTDLRSNKAYLLAHKSMLLHLLGKEEEAFSVISDALKEKENDPYFLKHKGLFLASLSRHEEALAIFNEIKGKLKENDDITTLLGANYYLNSQKNEAIQVLEEALYEDSTDYHFNKNALLLLLHIYKKEYEIIDSEKVETNIKTIIDRYPDNVAILADSCGYFRIKGNIEKANYFIEKALLIIRMSKVSSSDLFIVSEELQNQGRFEEAIKIEEKIIDVNLNNHLTYNLAKLYQLAGKRDKALNIYQNLRSRYGVIEEITKHEVRIYQEIGDLVKASEIATQYVAVFNDIHAKIVLNGLNIRLEKFDKVNAFLNSHIDYFKLNLAESKSLLAQMFKMGLNEKAIDIAYELKRLNETPEYNDFYAYAIFSRKEKQNDEYLNIQQIAINCVVFLKEKSGNIFHVILDKRDDELLKENEINQNVPLFNQLLGKQIGEKIEYANRYTSEIVEIVEIKHKYIHNFHESLEKISTIYRGRSLFDSIDTSELLEGKLPEFIQKQLEDGESKHNKLQEFKEQYYKTHRCTLGTIASFTNTHPIKIWNDLIRNEKIGVQVCVGNNEEIISGTTLLNLGRKLCFDFISLITLYQIEEIREKVINKHGKIKITQSVSDLLSELISEEENFTDGENGTLFSRGGKNYFISISINEKKKQIESLYEFKKWINENCEIEPCQLILQYSSEKINDYNKVLGESFFETCLLAKEHGYLLISEDLAFRTICKTEFGLDGAWCQIILIDLIKNGLINAEQYHKSLQTFVNQNYKHTSIDANTLLFEIKESNWKISDQFRKFTKIFYGNQSSPNAIIVATQFLLFLWQDTAPTIEQKQKITFQIIGDYLTERSIFDHIIWIRQAAKMIFENDPINLHHVLNELNRFRKFLNNSLSLETEIY